MGLATELDLLCCRCSASLPNHLSQLNCPSCHDGVKIVEKHWLCWCPTVFTCHSLVNSLTEHINSIQMKSTRSCSWCLPYIKTSRLIFNYFIMAYQVQGLHNNKESLVMWLWMMNQKQLQYSVIFWVFMHRAYWVRICNRALNGTKTV
jgi:hypothetical protein